MEARAIQGTSERNQGTGSAAAKARLEAFLTEHRRQRGPQPGLETFERELHSRMAEVEREILAEELTQLDVDVPSVLIEGVLYHRVLRCEAT